MFKKRHLFFILMLCIMVTVAFGCGSKPAEQGSTAQNSSGEGNSEGAAIDYPTKPIEVMVPWGAGGDTDVIARIVNKYLEEELGQAVVTINMPGGGGSIGGLEGLNAAPDGYMITNGHNSIGISYLLGTTDYSYFDFQPVAAMSSLNNVIATNADNPWNDMSDVIEASKEEKLGFAAVVGSTTHLMALGIMDKAGIEFNFVEYNDTASRIQALLGNHIDLAPVTVAAAQQYIESGQFKVLGIMSDSRNSSIPDVPTLKEQGIDFSFLTTRGYFVPKDTPIEIVEILSDAFGKVAKNPGFIEEIQNMGLDVHYMNYKEYEEYLRNDMEVLETIMRNQGLID